MNSGTQEPPASGLKQEGEQIVAVPAKPRRGRNTRPPLPEDYKELCALCRAGKLFAVQDWFKTHKYKEPEHHDRRAWPMGIAIEKGFHSLVEVLLQNSVVADGSVLYMAASWRRRDMIELLFRYGARADSIDLGDIIHTGDPELIRMFIDRGADIITGHPLAKGLIEITRPFLGIYKSYLPKFPELHFQADMALRHFCQEGNLRGVSLLMWLGANPRARVPTHSDEDEMFWETPLEAAASKGKIEIIKRLKIDPAVDNLNALLHRSIHKKDIELVKFWISHGADINHANEEGRAQHYWVMTYLEWDLDTRSFLCHDSAASKRFANEWFSLGAKWVPDRDDFRVIRKVLARLSYMEAYEFIKLLLNKEVVGPETLGEILDTPKMREHLKDRRAALASLIPRLQKWIKSEQHKIRKEQNAIQKTPDPGPPPLPPAHRVSWKDPRFVRRLGDE